MLILDTDHLSAFERGAAAIDLCVKLVKSGDDVVATTSVRLTAR